MKKNLANDDDFGAVLNCAVRYCIGRATYMPGLVTDWIMDNCDGKLTGRTVSVMKRDIDEATQRNALGMDCDVRTWARFRIWLEGQNTEVEETREVDK